MSQLTKAIKNPRKAVRVVLNDLLTHYAHLIKNDEKYIRWKWKLNMDYPLNLNNPQSFNEKLQWLKLNTYNPHYTTLVDKVAVKSFIADKLGAEYVIPTIHVYEHPYDIDWDSLPNQFVLKCTNDSASIVICKDKSRLNRDDVIKGFRKGLKHNYFLKGREWPYKEVPPRIIAEEYIETEHNSEGLRDYKFFCFDGEVKCFKIDYDRFTRHRANYYSPNGELLLFGEEICPPDFNKKLEIPAEIKEMINLAEKLAKGIPFVRVDFYNVNGRILFGEMTFFPAGGLGRFIPEEWDYKLGEWLHLPL